MNLHEYQSKRLFAQYDLPVPKGVMVNSVEQAMLAVNFLNTAHWVVKAQVHAGGRGKAGGVKLVGSKEQLASVARSLLHSRLVTYQTDAKGQPINQLLVEETSEVDREFYLAATIDRATQQVVFIVSKEGGVEIEKIAQEMPDKILKLGVDPILGVMPYKCRDLSIKLELNDIQTRQFTRIMENLYKLFIENDLSLVEVNPLVVTKRGDMMCLDAKVNVDDSALYRQHLLRDMRDTTQEDKKELLAREWDLNYISLDGDIGCMVNGAGLAMATMDLIKLSGGNPANFLDVGGGATEERVREAFKIILSDGKVKAVLVNIFGGIVRCDLIAKGIINAVSEVGIEIPVVVRLEGNRADEAGKLLAKSGLNIIVGKTFTEAAEKVVAAAGE